MLVRVIRTHKNKTLRNVEMGGGLDFAAFYPFK
jgi:hypothetical protein